MTVSDLIEKLLQMPQEAHVYMEVEENDIEYVEGMIIDDDGDVRLLDGYNKELCE